MSIALSQNFSPDVRQDHPILNSVPFGNDPRGMDKLLVAMCVVHYNWPETPISAGGGVTVPIATKEALQHSDRDTETDQQFVRRFFQSDWVVTFRESTKGANEEQHSHGSKQEKCEDSGSGGPDNDLWAAPSEKLVELLRSLDNGMDQFEPSDSDGFREYIRTVLASGVEGNTETPDSFSAVIAPLFGNSEASTDDFARERVRKGLSRHVTYLPDESHQYRREVLADQLRIDVEGRWKQIEDGEKLWNRMTSWSEAANGYRRIKAAFEKAAEIGHRRGTEVVITSSPQNVDSHEELAEKVNDGLGAFFDNQRHRDVFDASPDRVGVIEHTDSALPHAHVIFFGVGVDQYPTEWAKGFLDDKPGIGEQIHFNEVGYDREQQRWVYSHKEAPPDEYYTKYSKMMMDIAEGGDPLQLTREGGKHWKLALLWATDKIGSHERISDSLTSEVEPDQVCEEAPDWLSENKTPDWLENPGPACEKGNSPSRAPEIRESIQTRTKRDEWLQDGIPRQLRRALNTTLVQHGSSGADNRSSIQNSKTDHVASMDDPRTKHLRRQAPRELAQRDTRTKFNLVSTLLLRIQKLILHHLNWMFSD